jgi:hypothetical protein
MFCNVKWIITIGKMNKIKKIANVGYAVLAFLLFSFAQKSKAQDSIPILNQQIIEYVKTTIGKKVDRGECWDLANQALTQNNADWNHEYKYGRLLNPKKDTIFPGDIIQFEGVKVKYKKGNTTYTETMDHHTAIVYRVIERNVFELAHQNTGFSGRKVGLSTLDLETIIKGKMTIYRPVRKVDK